MKKILFVLLILTSFLQTSCSPDPIDNSPITNPVDVYVGGSKNNQACYWKNNQLVILDTNGLPSTYATKIIVSNGDVYVLGYGGDATVFYTLFWKNGVLTNLNTAFNTVGLYINDFDVVGNDVYIVGYASNFPANGYNFGYWKNGVRTILNNNTPDFNPSYIKVLNNDVYTSINFPTQGYYINTTYHDTPNKTNNGLINYGNEMYVYGGFSLSGFYYNISNNTNTNISFPNDGSITNMSFDNNNTYYTNNKAIYKNGNILVPETAINFITDFEVQNNNLYFITNIIGSQSQYVTLNNTIVLSNASNERFYSLYVVQN